MKSISTLVTVSYMDGKFEAGGIYVRMYNTDNHTTMTLQERITFDYKEAMQQLRQFERVNNKVATMKHCVHNYKDTGKFTTTTKILDIYQILDD